MRELFQRRIVHGYPTDHFEADISSNFRSGTRATVTLEQIEGITAGDQIVETHFDYVDGRLVKIAERLVTHS